MTAHISRRVVVKGLLASLTVFATGGLVEAAEAKKPEQEDNNVAVKWLDELKFKGLGGPLQLGRFADPMYYLLSPIVWTPNANSAPELPSVTVPKGFVTDMASVPRIFYSLFRPDGDYAQAAIVHDYLYWEQFTTKEVADKILRVAMEDLEVSKSDEWALFQAVSRFGASAWQENKKLKLKGEKRVLKQYLSEAKTRWEQFKKDPSVFA